MSFDVYGAKTSDSSNSVDFAAMNKYVVETANLQERETLVGYISQIVDLGTQKLPDAESVFNGKPEDEAIEIEQRPSTYFKDGINPDTKKPCRMKCWPQKPQQCVAFAVDFPDIIIDKGTFFGKSKPLPLRLWMGGQFYTEDTGVIIQRPTPLGVVNLDKTRATKKWSMSQNGTAYKMAVAAKLIKAGEAFLPNRIDELLGKAFQFEAQVFFKQGKGDKQFYTEYVKFVGALGRNNPEPERITTPHMIQFFKHNDETAVKELRAHIVNTIKQASNYDSSHLKRQIEAVRGGGVQNDTATTEDDAPANDVSTGDSAHDSSFDDDIPF